MSEFAPVLNVSALNGLNGFRLDGDALNDGAGRAVAGGGDVNGDGFADLLVGAGYSDAGGTNRGLAWVVFGAASAPAAMSLAARVAAGTAYRFQGEALVDEAGYAISNAGDANGDGFDDFIIGAPLADPDAVNGDRGASYLVFGGAAMLELADALDGNDDNLISLANPTAGTRYRFDGVANVNSSGASVSGAGDVNGDGVADLLIGAPVADPNSGGGNGNEGASYIVFGGAANLAALDGEDGTVDGKIDLANVTAGQGQRLDGATVFPNDYSGFSVALAGDVNGDGFADALVGARAADPIGGNTSEGAAYLVFGQAQALFTAGSLDLAFLTGLDGTRFDGAAAGDRAGNAVNGLGDVNGDGFADIVIGAPFADSPGNNDAGAAYVVFGKSAFGASSDLAALNGSNGFRLEGIRAGDQTGISASAAGDVNGDGFADILVGAHIFGRPGALGAGAAFVVFGKASGFAASIDLGSLDGDSGFRIEGAGLNDFLGRGSAGAAGDVNGDGFGDIIVGADGADNGAVGSGSAYVIYGHRAGTAVTRVGTALANRINGGRDDDTISGLSGNDMLFGWEGDDEIAGAAGIDTIDGGADDDTITGGSGADTLSGGTGADALNGGSGQDTASYFASAAGVNLALDGSFAATGDAAFDTLTSIERVKGSNFADSLRGNTAANWLFGLRGNDTLDGSGGDDLLIGGIGKDTMTGGLGADVFDFNTIAESAVATADIITDFDSAASDILNLFTIDAIPGGGNDAFTFIGTTDFTALGEARTFQQDGNTFVELNTTGTPAADMRIELTGLVTLDGADFVL